MLPSMSTCPEHGLSQMATNIQKKEGMAMEMYYIVNMGCLPRINDPPQTISNIIVVIVKMKPYIKFCRTNCPMENEYMIVILAVPNKSEVHIEKAFAL